MRTVRTPIARASDPAGSHEAAHVITASGRRQMQHNLTVTAVLAHPGATTQELAKKSGLSERMLSRRLSECVTGGAIRRGQDRRCTVSGITVTTWWPAGTPIQLELVR